MNRLLTSLLTIALLWSGLVGAQDERRNPYLILGSHFDFFDSGDPLRDWNSVRDWKSTDGRSLKAKILSVEGDTAKFLVPGGQEIDISMSRFSKEDQRFVAEWKEVSRFFNLGYQKSRNVSNTVESELNDGAFAKEGKIHETRNFKFVCDEPLNALTVKDFSRMFEATYAVVRSLPLGLEVDEPLGGKFKVRLFSEKDDYHREGGPANSAGVYILKSREIMVPLSSLGLKRVGKTFRKAGEYDPSTLVHEITHAVTHQWITYMPMWVAEGLADYVAAIPYRNGVFDLNQHAQGIYRMVASNFGGDAMRFRILQPDEFVYLSKDEFMERETEPEKLIELTDVKPFQIRIVGENSPVPTQENQAPKPKGLAVSIPVHNPVDVNPSSIVVQRYSSSMLLLQSLFDSGQVAALRKYLFANLHFEWGTEKYITDYNSELENYQETVKTQIADFDEILARFNGSIRNYNEIVTRKNSGEAVSLPAVPIKPKVPKALAVPEILSNPRSSDYFSRRLFRYQATKEYLRLPANLPL